MAYQVENLHLAARKTRGIESQRSSMVGREKELGELRTSVENLLAGQGQLVALVGEAGVGKSRLVEELHESIRASTYQANNVLWLEGRCLELGMDVSYWPFQDMLRQYFAWSEEEEAPHNDQRVADSIQSLIEAGYLLAARGAEIVSLLSRLLSLRVPRTIQRFACQPIPRRDPRTNLSGHSRFSARPGPPPAPAAHLRRLALGRSSLPGPDHLSSGDPSSMPHPAAVCIPPGKRIPDLSPGRNCRAQMPGVLSARFASTSCPVRRATR